MHPKIPSELFEEMLCHIPSSSDLYSFLFVSRSVHNEAERILYRNITIDASKVNEQFAECLKNPRYANLVRSLAVTSKTQYWPEQCTRVLHTTLQHLVNLKHFQSDCGLSFDVYGQDVDLIYLLEHATTSLESLVFSGIAKEHFTLLEKQSQLKELIMDNGRVPWNPGAFPEIVVVGCPGDLAVDCLEDPTGNSKVSRLRWTQGLPDGRWPPFCAIRALDLFLFTVDTRVFVKIVCKFPSLEYLKCTVKPAGFLQRLSDADFDRILALPLSSLRKVYLHIKQIYAGESWQHISLFDCIPSLRVVQLQFGNEPMSRRCCRQDPTLWSSISSQPDEWKYYDLDNSTSSELVGNLKEITLNDLRSFP